MKGMIYLSLGGKTPSGVQKVKKWTPLRKKRKVERQARKRNRNLQL